MLESNGIKLLNVNNMDFMKTVPDKFFELAICDPPYGINIGTEINREGFAKGTSNNSLTKFESSMKSKDWDSSRPPKEYFEELFRISKNQIIFGGNYFLDYLGKTKCLIVWDKMTYIPTMSRIEIAWTSFERHSVLVQINSNQRDRVHPTQKPVELYEFLLGEFAKPNHKIFDSHLGSGSSAIASDKMGFEFVGCEIDEEYFSGAVKRLKLHQDQYNLFSKNAI